ncbi:uncharacterized protein BDFB_000526 [Asbolus verrucosus]|uniref:Sperm microtubule inner protein 1 C-terminal domain-containing protein n=1 Tax=Asbolus verrucosus TaxID=1661398 RepID=A0A482VRJ9_ASBVE|nr:uncharacterized protein BDFB_000526 [Asbolus verrucosus]
MENTVKKWRGITPEQQKLWVYQIEKEDKLRLKWFKKNEKRLEDIANRKNIREVSKKIHDEVKDKMLHYFQNREMHVVPPPNEDFMIPIAIDEDALYNIMRLVPKEVRNLLYASTQNNDGRMTYLKERYKTIPEQRYYFPETTNFNYGWNMWQHSKDMQGSTFARQQVIKNSFYRRRGVENDPEWYKEPAKLSPNVCGCI